MRKLLEEKWPNMGANPRMDVCGAQKIEEIRP